MLGSRPRWRSLGVVGHGTLCAGGLRLGAHAAVAVRDGDAAHCHWLGHWCAVAGLQHGHGSVEEGKLRWRCFRPMVKEAWLVARLRNGEDREEEGDGGVVTAER